MKATVLDSYICISFLQQQEGYGEVADVLKIIYPKIEKQLRAS
jgi:hypothetical protein